MKISDFSWLLYCLSVTLVVHLKYLPIWYSKGLWDNFWIIMIVPEKSTNNMHTSTFGMISNCDSKLDQFLNLFINYVLCCIQSSYFKPHVRMNLWCHRFSKLATQKIEVLKLNISRYRTIWPNLFIIFILSLSYVHKVILTSFWLSFK